MHPADYHPARTRNIGKAFSKSVGFKNIKFPVKIRDTHKIEKQNCIDINVFGYENKEKYPIYVSQNPFKRHVDLLFMAEKGKRHYVFIKDFNTFMYDHTLYHGRKL